MRFYVGLHMPSHAHRFARCLFSVNELRRRRSGFGVNEWILDSGAFTEVARHGGYREGVADYAAEVNRWKGNGHMVAAVAQDWMCEPFVVARTGLSVREHQRRTVERYADLRALTDAPLMPVLQGYHPDDYARHVEEYGDLLPHGAWVGVGSVCKRNANPSSVAAVLWSIKRRRPDLRLHGFGVKLTALRDGTVRSMLHSADSKAWSVAAWREGRDCNDWREAAAYVDRVEAACARPAGWVQPMLEGVA
jgi:hypothetical protein